MDIENSKPVLVNVNLAKRARSSVLGNLKLHLSTIAVYTSEWSRTSRISVSLCGKLGYRWPGRD